jgi:hypothetical protein
MVYKLPEGMKPLKSAGDPYSDAVRAKIKGSSSDRRKIAQKINSIPRMNEENVEKAAWELISNENLSAAHIERLILEMLKKPLKEELRAKLIDTAIKAHQAIHGSKTKNLNLNVNKFDSAENLKKIWVEVQNERKRNIKTSASE